MTITRSPTNQFWTANSPSQNWMAITIQLMYMLEHNVIEVMKVPIVGKTGM
jgi:hypothetical protein